MAGCLFFKYLFYLPQIPWAEPPVELIDIAVITAFPLA